MRKKLFGQLQRIGKALMLPVAILPAGGLLLAIGLQLCKAKHYNTTCLLYKMVAYKLSLN